MSQAANSDAHLGLATSFTTKAATEYELRAGGATRFLGRKLIPLLEIPDDEPCLIHDNACGTGIMTVEILASKPSNQHLKFHASDIAKPMLDAFRAELSAMPNIVQDQIIIEELDSCELSTVYPSDTFDRSVTNLGIFFFADAAEGAQGIYDTLKPGGIAVVSVWKNLMTSDVLKAAQADIKPSTPYTTLGVFEKWRDPVTLDGVMRAGGFQNVLITEVACVFAGLQPGEDALVTAVAANLGVITARMWSDEERSRLPAAVKNVMAREESRAWRVVVDGTEGLGATALVAVAKK